MNSYLLTTYVHILLGIALVGYALFWVILSARGKQEGHARDSSSPEDRSGWLELLHRTPWPPRGLPVPVRVPLWALGWLMFAAVVVSGALILGVDASLGALRSGPFEWVSLRTKLVGVGLAGAGLLLASLRPRRGVWIFFFVMLIAIVCLSSVLAR